MPRQRVLVVSHTYAAPVNRRKFQLMARDERFEWLLVTPRKWQNDLMAADNTPAGESDGYRLELVDVRFGGHPVTYLIPGLRRIIREFEPHLIMCEQEPVYFVSLQVTLQSGGVPLVYFSFQNIDRTDITYRILAIVRAICYRRSTCLVAGSAAVASVVRQHGYGKPIYVTPHLGVNEELFRVNRCPSRRAAITSRGFLIGFFGRFSTQKGVASLLQAVASGGQIADWHLLLVGGGPERAELERMARVLGLGPQVTFAPPVTHDRVPDLMNCCDVIVVASKTTPTWKEQFGHVLVGAMACGVPVIGSSSGEIPNVIGDGGLVFDEDRTDDLRAKLEQLSDDRALRETLSRNGLKRVRERFTDASMAANMTAVCETVLGMESRTPSTLKRYPA